MQEYGGSVARSRGIGNARKVIKETSHERICVDGATGNISGYAFGIQDVRIKGNDIAEDVVRKGCVIGESIIIKGKFQEEYGFMGRGVYGRDGSRGKDVRKRCAGHSYRSNSVDNNCCLFYKSEQEQ